jgi:hypothetical protein
MYNSPLVRPDFVIPDQLDGDDYVLRMLSIDDVEKDFEAVMASAGRLRGLLDPGSTWPDGLTLKEDLIDLAWHHREFTLRRSFAYTVMSKDESRCLGCCYIFPSRVTAYDAAAFYWVRSGPDAERRDAELGTRLRNWLRAAWPFETVAFPGRDIPWTEWGLLQPPNGPNPGP